MNTEAFDRAVEKLGGVTKVADLLKTSVQTIVNWRARGAVPADRCKAFEALTGLSVRDMRDDWADYWPDVSKPHRGRSPKAAA